MKIKVDDEVKVLQGKDKGKKGKVEKIFTKKNMLLVTGINIYKKHVKKKGRTPGGIIEVTKPILTSKVAFVCPKCNLAGRVGFGASDGKKVRMCKRCKQQV